MSFVNFCQSLGIQIDHVPPVGVWTRYKTDDKQSKRNGAVKYMGDHGFAQNHATMSEPAVWKSDRPLDAIQIKQNRIDMQNLRRREIAKQRAAIVDMRAYFESLNPLREGHPYLDRKGLSMNGCRDFKTDGENLVIPMYGKSGLISIQTITPDGQKKYRYSCPTKGGHLALKRKNSIVTGLAEGVATGLAIYQCIPDSSVFICFSAGNLVTVARELCLKGLAVVCADNDHETEKKTGANTGISKGREAAESLGCGVAYPTGINGTDWADAMQEWESKFRVKNEIMRHAKMLL